MESKSKKKQHGIVIFPVIVLILAGICCLGLFRGEAQSKSGILLEAQSGKVLWKKHSGSRVYPASLTKMMTAAVILWENPDCLEPVVVPEEIFPELTRQNAAVAGFLPGETVSVKDLLYGMMLPSGAECAKALAIWNAGSEEAFVEKMNLLAEELGMWDSNFVNCTGLHEKDHYSTAEDLGRLFRYALSFPEFREIITSQSYEVAPTEEHPEGFTVYHSLLKRAGELSLENGKIIGGKTGFTNEAGLCLASIALDKQGKEYILITLNALGKSHYDDGHIKDAKLIYEKYFTKGEGLK